MGIEAKCGQCGKQYSVPETWAGKRVQCPRCQTSVDIPVQVVDVVVTGDDVPSPFIDPRSDMDDLDDLPEQSGEGRWKTVRSDHLTNRPDHSLAQLANALPKKLLRRNRLMIGVGIGASLSLILALRLFLSKGFDLWLLPHAFLLTLGIVLLVDGLKKKSARHNKSRVKSRMVRAAGWTFGGFCCAALALLGMVVVARTGVPIPSVVVGGYPLLIVPLFVSFVAAILLVYNFLVLLFPKANVLRFIAFGYIALTVALPLLVIPIELISNLAKHDRQTATAPDNQAVDDRDQRPKINGMEEPLEDHLPSSAARAKSRRQSHDLPTRSRSRPGETNTQTPRSSGPQAENPFASKSGRQGHFPSQRPLGLNRLIPGRRNDSTPRPGGGNRSARQAPPSFESTVAKFASRFGSQRVVTVLADPVDNEEFQRITESIRKAAHADRTGCAASLTNGMLRVAVGPINDIQAFADRLDIGTVIDVNQSGHTITVEVRAP